MFSAFKLIPIRSPQAFALIVLLAITLFASAAHAQDKLELFGGYSYLRPSITAEEIFSCPPGVLCPLILTPPTFVSNRQGLNGWEVSGGLRILPLLRIVADFSGHYGPTVGSGSSRTHQYTYLLGPEVALPSRVSPFAHVLFGASQQTQSFGFFPINSAGDNSVQSNNHTAFAVAIGGGIDLRLIPHIWLRPIQFDYLATRFSGNTQNQPRISAGLVLRF